VVFWIGIGMAFLTLVSGWIGIRRMEASWERNIVIGIAITIFTGSIFMAYWSEKDRRENNEIITGLQEKTKKTVFTKGTESWKKLPDGRYEVEFDMIPVGENIVPIFKLQCHSLSNAKIFQIFIEGEVVPIMTEDGESEDKTTRLKVVRNFEPGVLTVKILMDKISDLYCMWEPQD